MTSNPVYSYKTSTIGNNPPAPKTGKADTAGSSGTSGTASTPSADSSYMDGLEAAGYAKTGKTPASGDTGSGDAVTDLLNTLDKINNEGVPQGNMLPFGKISAEDALSKYPDAPQDVLTKFNSIISIIQTKLGDLDKGLKSGTGTPQQVQTAQTLKSQLEDLLSYYKIQRDKVAEIIPQKEKFWTGEIKNFQANGGSGDPRDFDTDGDGWIGRPSDKSSYRIGTRTFDKAYEDLTAKKLHDAGATNVKYKFKKGDVQYWAINQETGNRVQFDPKTKKVIGDQVAAPGYVANMGTGFGDDDNANIVPDSKGMIELKAKQLSNSQNFAEAGLELHTPEYVYVEVDSSGEIVKDDMDNLKLSPFEMKDGQLTQKTPSADDPVHYKQIYVKEMKVSTDSPDGSMGGDIVVELKGGDDNTKIMSMRIKGPDSKTKASDVALAITSGTGASQRETPIELNAGSYESTCRVGIQNPKNFSDQFDYDGKKAKGDQKDQINDTLKNFMAQSSNGKISSDVLLNRGISAEISGHFIGTSDNDLIVIKPPQDYLTVDDAAYTTVIEGGAGHNAIFGKEVGSAFVTGATLAYITNTKAEGEISIGINPYGEKKTATGNIAPLSGNSGQSNKLYIHVDAPQSKVAIQSANDGKLNASTNTGTGDPAADAWDQSNDDYYDVTGNEVATNTLDANNPNQSFDPDLQAKNGRKPIKGKMTSANTNDFTANGESYKEHLDKLVDSIKKKATEKEEDWKIDGTTQDWMKGKYYQADKTTLDQFFSDFSASKVNTMDPFKQLEDGMTQAS